jgi:hypothetical protein
MILGVESTTLMLTGKRQVAQWCENDPRWYDETRSLVLFLARPRTWVELSKWAQENHVTGTHLNNCLAWLDSRHEAWATYNSQEIVFWVAKPLTREGEVIPPQREAV